MKLDKKITGLLVIGVCFFVISAVWIYHSVSKISRVTKNSYSFGKEKNESEWLRYNVIREKISRLNRGWQKPTDTLKADSSIDVTIPINDAVAVQINEIKRIYEEEILGKLSEANRIYQEFRQNLYREYEIKEAEKIKEVKSKLEIDLASEKERQRQTLEIFYQDLERKQQYTLINLELQKKMLNFNSIEPKKLQSESERIDSEIARIRNEIKKKFDQRSDELDKDNEFYQKRRTAEYHTELSDFRKTKQKLIQEELSRFREEQMNEFRVWNNQRQTDVNQAVELRRSQQ